MNFALLNFALLHVQCKLYISLLSFFLSFFMPKRMFCSTGGDGQRPSPASHYTHLCEHYTWSGTCSKGYLCPRFHHRLRPPYVWQLKVFGDWQDFSATDNEDIEKRFCALVQHEVYEVTSYGAGDGSSFFGVIFSFS